MVDEFDQLEPQSKGRWRLRRVIVNLFVFAAALLVGYYLLRGTQEVSVPSRVWSDPIRIYARQDGKIKKIDFTETESFQEGDLLFQIEDPVLESQIDTTSGSIARYEGKIEEARSDLAKRIDLFQIIQNIEDARQQIKEKKVTRKKHELARQAAIERVAMEREKFNRAQALFTSGAIVRTTLETYRLALQTAQDSVKVIEADIELVDETIQGLHRKITDLQQHRDDMTSATARLVAEYTDLKAREQNRLTELRSQRKLLDYFADINGIVAARHRNDLESVRTGELVLEVTAGEHIWVDAYLLPEDTHLAQKGDIIEVRYQDQPFKTVVAWKSPKAVLLPWRTPSLDGREERYIQLRLTFLEPAKAEAAGLLPGIMVETILQRREGILYRLGLRTASDDTASTTTQSSPAPTTPSR
jgi:multidrug resistance efflux pump